MPPNTIPQPTIDVQNYSPAMQAQLIAAFNQGLPFWLALPFTFATADATVLFTVPAGGRLYVHRTLWEIAVSMTGGSTPAIGLSSSATGYTTKGDLQGGASGDLTAALTAGLRPGTLGAKFGSNGVVVLPAAATVRFDRVADAFTAGSGFAHLHCSLLPSS